MFGSILLQLLRGAITGELSHLLEKFKENNGEEKYLQLIAALKNSLLLLQDVAEDTKTKIDDTLISILLDSLPQSEENNLQSAAPAPSLSNDVKEEETGCKHPKATQADSGVLICDSCGAEIQ